MNYIESQGFFTMPHFQIEYSSNLEDCVDIGALCDVIRREASTIDIFPLAGLRVRAICVDHYSIADGDSKHSFIDISVRLREGRTDDQKSSAITKIFSCVEDYLSPILSTRSIALSAEMRDIDASLSPKTGTIRDHLGKSQ